MENTWTSKTGPVVINQTMSEQRLEVMGWRGSREGLTFSVGI